MITVHRGIRVTNVPCTLVDVAPRLHRNELEAGINEADRLGLVDPKMLRRSLGDYAGLRGVALIRDVLDERTFTLTESALSESSCGSSAARDFRDL